MTYALSTIWFERQRFLPAVLAVAFSAVLIAVQAGLMLGLFSMISMPVDQSRADVWVGYPGVRSVDLGRPIPERWTARVAGQPEVERVETAMIGFALWVRPASRERPQPPEVVTVVGTRLTPDSLGAVQKLREQPELMARLVEPYTVAVDAGELNRLGVTRVGETAEVQGHRVRIVGLVSGYQSVGGPYLFCSLETARQITREPKDVVTYILAKTRTPEDAQAVAERLRNYRQLGAYTADELSRRSRLYWLFVTKAGIAVGFTALLGLLVGAVVTSQTLYAATAASQREFATLRAMGIPTWRLRLVVVEQSLWVGLFGVVVAAPVTFLLAATAGRLGTQARLHPIVLTVAAAVTLVMALAAGLAALRSFRNVDPAHNIR